MPPPHDWIPTFLSAGPPQLVQGAGALGQLGPLAARLGGRRVLLVTDAGIAAAGHVARTEQSLRAAGLEVAVFAGVEENPSEAHVAAGVEAARKAGVDLLVGLGGGSAMDCAKGVNFVLTGGGRMRDYWGEGKAAGPMRPLVAIPTTAGTGSEAQSYALIAHADTHQKMACGDKRALPRVAILDPVLTATMPRGVAAATGIDAVAHAVETSASRRRNRESLELSRRAWELLSAAFEPSLADPADADARTRMLVGAHLAGAAIERSMLGAAHACANPLTARFGIVHGQAVGLMLPHVIRFNAAGGEDPYAELEPDAEVLARRIERLLAAAALPLRLRDLAVQESVLLRLADEAAQQWTARFNPRPVTAAELLAVYRSAY